MAGSELKIGVSAFKATCLDLLDKVARRKVSKVVVTKRGRPVALVTAPPSARATAGELYGCMKGRVVAPKNFDFTAPILDKPLLAAKGRLFE